MPKTTGPRECFDKKTFFFLIKLPAFSIKDTVTVDFETFKRTVRIRKILRTDPFLNSFWRNPLKKRRWRFKTRIEPFT